MEHITMSNPKVFLFVDNSNLFISAKKVAGQREGRNARDNARIYFENLFKLALAGRQSGGIYVVGSIPPDEGVIWDRLAAAAGVDPELYERGKESGGEQGLDQCLQVHMLRAATDNPEPQIAVLMTGDGAGYDDGVGFHADLERMHKAGWGIEVVSWETSCKHTLRDWAKAKGSFVKMEDFYEAVTFIEGGRRVKALDLAGRPTSAPAMGAAQKAALKLEEEMARLRAEMSATMEKALAQQKGQARYEKRMARRQTRTSTGKPQHSEGPDRKLNQ
jgi:hypothetical protein